MKKKWKNMSQSKKNTLEIIIALLIMFAFFGYKIYSNYLEAKQESEFSKKTYVVTDNSRYFTIISCLDKYLNTVQSGNDDNILITLEDEYKKTYNVNKSNLDNYVPKLEKAKIYSYTGSEMYAKRISRNVVEYYVKGGIKGSSLDEKASFTEYDVTVILYESEFLFSIRPGVNL